MILKQKGDERTRACGSRRVGLSFEKFFLYGYFTRTVYLLCLRYPFGLVFFLKLTWTFLISIVQFLFRRHTATEKYKRKLNHLFLFFSFFPFLHTVLREYAQHYKVSFFFFYTLNFQADTRRVHFRCLVTHHSSLITHGSSLITHGSSLITHGSSLIITPGFHQDSWLPS